MEVRGIRKVLAGSVYGAAVGADCVWGSVIVPGKWDHNREEAYDGTLRVGDYGKGDVDLRWGRGIEKGRRGNGGGPRDAAW